MLTRQGFLRGVLSTIGAFSSKPIQIAARTQTVVAGKSISLWKLILRATRAKVADEIKLGVNQVDLSSVERRASSDALGDFIINDMKQNPEKYLR